MSKGKLDYQSFLHISCSTFRFCVGKKWGFNAKLGTLTDFLCSGGCCFLMESFAYVFAQFSASAACVAGSPAVYNLISCFYFTEVYGFQQG